MLLKQWLFSQNRGFGLVGRVSCAVILLFGVSLFPAHHAKARTELGDAPWGWSGQTGTASYYGMLHQGRTTASGALFDQYGMTAAHAWLPFGTRLRVTVRETGRSVVVTVTDRLPFGRRIIDLSYGAAARLGIVRAGLAAVRLTPV